MRSSTTAQGVARKPYRRRDRQGPVRRRVTTLAHDGESAPCEQPWACGWLWWACLSDERLPQSVSLLQPSPAQAAAAPCCNGVCAAGERKWRCYTLQGRAPAVREPRLRDSRAKQPYLGTHQGSCALAPQCPNRRPQPQPLARGHHAAPAHPLRRKTGRLGLPRRGSLPRRVSVCVAGESLVGCRVPRLPLVVAAWAFLSGRRC